MEKDKKMQVNRDFKGVWIPKEIWLDENLTWMEKLLLVEIDSLCTSDKGCFAQNDYFAKFFGLSKDRISKLITSLRKKGYIEIKLIYKPGTMQISGRKITTIGYRRKCLEGIGENNYTPIGENAEDNNTYINNTLLIKEESSPSSEKKDEDYPDKEFRKKLETLKQIILIATGKSEYELNLVFKPVFYKKIIDKLLENIEKSDYLQGKCNSKPNLNTFTVISQVKRILAGAYENRKKEKKKQDKEFKYSEEDIKKTEELYDFLGI